MAALMAAPMPAHRETASYWQPEPWFRSIIAGASEGHVARQRLALHGVLEAVDAGLDDAVDVVGLAVVEGLHQAELGQGLGEKAPGVPDGALFHVGLVDHPIIPHRRRRSGVEATQRAEAVVRERLPAELVDVAEAARLPAAKGADAYPSKSRLRFSLSSGHSRIRCEPSTTKRLMAFAAIDSSSVMVRVAMGWCSRPRPSSHCPIAFAASRVTCACH